MLPPRSGIKCSLWTGFLLVPWTCSSNILCERTLLLAPIPNTVVSVERHPYKHGYTRRLGMLILYNSFFGSIHYVYLYYTSWVDIIVTVVVGRCFSGVLSTK